VFDSEVIMTRRDEPRVANSQRVRIGVIGAGWWASAAYLPLLAADSRVELAAVNRLGSAELETVRARFNVARGFIDYRDMLAAGHFDGIIVSSPHPQHFEHACAALDHGAHVLVEKPMTTRSAEARLLVQRAAQRNKQLLIPYGWNFSLIARDAHRLVREQAIGEVQHVSLHMASATFDLFSGEGLAEAKDHLFQPAASTWSDPAKAGGFAWGQLTHALGLLFRIVDVVPARVFAITRASPSGVDAHDAVLVQFANGAQASISGCALVPKHCGFQIDLRIFGSKGMLLLDIERERLEVRRHDRQDILVPLPTGAGAYSAAPVIDTFVRICNGEGIDNPAPGMVGQRAVEVIDALYRSAASGRLEAV
jgi:predicted dehydrogenase